MMVLLPKGRGGYWGVEFVEVVWKVCTMIINFCLKRSVLRKFRAVRGIGTVTLEAKLVQNMAGITNEPLLKIFLDVRKTYDSLDRGRCMEILRG